MNDVTAVVELATYGLQNLYMADINSLDVGLNYMNNILKYNYSAT